MNGAEILLDLVGTALEYLQQTHVSTVKSVRLCSQSVASLRTAVSRLVLFRLSELDDAGTASKEVIEFLAKMMYWQTVILSPENTDGEFTRLLCYLLYTRLIDRREDIRLAAANVSMITVAAIRQIANITTDASNCTSAETGGDFDLTRPGEKCRSQTAVIWFQNAPTDGNFAVRLL